MRFGPTEIADVVELEIEPRVDERGFFARAFCPEEMARVGLAFASSQINLSRNVAVHTLRGMHFQDPPYAEAKIVRAVSGAIYDVAVDLRPDSPSRWRWVGRVLDARRGNGLFVPAGFAHGFITLEPDTDVLYQMDRLYEPGHARGFRYDDPKIAITWPHPPAVVGAADVAWPALLTPV